MKLLASAARKWEVSARAGARFVRQPPGMHLLPGIWTAEYEIKGVRQATSPKKRAPSPEGNRAGTWQQPAGLGGREAGPTSSAGLTWNPVNQFQASKKTPLLGSGAREFGDRAFSRGDRHSILAKAAPIVSAMADFPVAASKLRDHHRALVPPI